MAFVAPKGYLIRGTPMREPRVNLGTGFGGYSWTFTQLDGVTAQNVYSDGNLTSSMGNVVTADATGLFVPIYLDPSLPYAAILKDGNGNVVRTHNPYTTNLTTFGNSQNQASGMKISTFGEIVQTGGAGGALLAVTLNATPPSGSCLKISAAAQGASAWEIDTSVTTGAQTANFASNSKPGAGSSSVFVTSAPTGGAYTGGTLTVPWPNVGGNFWTVTLSTGQTISNCTFTNNSTTFTCPSTVITGTPTTALTVTPQASGPVVWLPVFCDGVNYFMPLWRGDNFVPQAPPPTVVGEQINATTATFGGNGITSVTGSGATASPPNWFLPTTAAIGSQYWLNITKNAGLSGINFTAANGTWVNISSSGLAVASSGGDAAISGSYAISSNSAGTNVVASGSITLSGATGPHSQNINGQVTWNLNGDGTSSLGGGAISNWYSPTTGSIGNSYWLNITRTGGTAGSNFDHAQGAWTQITAGGLVIGLTNVTGNTTVTGTYQISSNSGGTLLVASGTIQLTASVQSVNYSGTAPLFLAGNGTATLNSVATTNWYTPTTTNIGGGMYLNITRTGGSTGINFSAAQGSWTNITNSGLTVALTALVGNYSVNGTYQISSNSSGTQLVTSGTISLSKNITSLLRIYTSGSGATETIPVGATNVIIEVWGSGGGGAGQQGAGSLIHDGGGGGAAGYCRTSKTLTSANWGQTLHYTVGAQSIVTGNGNASSASSGTLSITTMTANGGSGTTTNAGGAGGTASGGTAANVTGNAGNSYANGSAGGTGTTGTVSGDGSPYGAGGHGTSGSGSKGGTAAVVFYYT